MWEDCGFEIYETIGTSWVQQRLDDDDDPARTTRRLEVREHLASLQAKYYEIEAAMGAFSSEDREIIMKRWIYNLGRVSGDLLRQAVQELLAEVPEGLRGGINMQQDRAALAELPQGRAMLAEGRREAREMMKKLREEHEEWRAGRRVAEPVLHVPIKEE